jgi:hypothetical protein
MAKQICYECGEEQHLGGTGATASTSSKFLPINNFIFGNSYLPVCNNCIEKRIKALMEKPEYKESYWNFLNLFCQLMNIQFNPSLWEKLSKVHRSKTFIVYANMSRETTFPTVDWGEANRQYIELEKEKELEDSVPEIHEHQAKKLREKWGMNYSDESLVYLENLLNGIIKSQDVNGAKSYDEAMKLCKISLLIEERIRAGDDFDKLLGSYEKLTKVADFTPKNARNVNDFDSVGEVFSYLEKTGWMNKYYDGSNQDIVDTTMHNFQAYVRTLYTNESSITEEIDRRLEALKHVAELENKYYEDPNIDYDKYEKEAYDQKEEFNEDA